jgi:hypothetical protein
MAEDFKAADHARRLADYSMAFALLGELASAATEAQVIERIIGVFTTLCAPRRAVYLPMVESRPGTPVTAPPHETPHDDLERLANLSERWRRTPSGRGFALRIHDATGMLGALELDDLAVPESLEHYVNLGLGLVDVCALAIRNARTYDRLEATLAELRGALTEVKTLRGLLRICSACKRIRTDAGAWSQIEAYVMQHAEVQFTHGICPECERKLYPEFADDP